MNFCIIYEIFSFFLGLSDILLEGKIEPEQLWADEQKQIMKTRFNRSDVKGILEPGEVDLTISGEFLDGTRFEGIDAIRVIDKSVKK